MLNVHSQQMYICTECTFAMNVHLQWMYIRNECTFAMNVHLHRMYIRNECTFAMNVHLQWMYIRNECTFATCDVQMFKCTFVLNVDSFWMYICFECTFGLMHIIQWLMICRMYIQMECAFVAIIIKTWQTWPQCGNNTQNDKPNVHSFWMYIWRKCTCPQCTMGEHVDIWDQFLQS